MTKGKDKEDQFISKLDKLEVAGKQRESGLEELLVNSGAELEDEVPNLPEAAEDNSFEFKDDLEEDPERFEEKVSQGLSSDDPVTEDDHEGEAFDWDLKPPPPKMKQENKNKMAKKKAAPAERKKSKKGRKGPWI